MASNEEQNIICKNEGVEIVSPLPNTKLGIALSTLGKEPINGVRHAIENGTCGWYLWCGEELSNEEGFFKPLHIEHIKEYLPLAEKYLALPVGYRFLATENYEDIWFDESIKNV